MLGKVTARSSRKWRKNKNKNIQIIKALEPQKFEYFCLRLLGGLTAMSQGGKELI